LPRPPGAGNRAAASATGLSSWCRPPPAG